MHIVTKPKDDEATFTAELRDQRIKYENEYRDYIAQQRKEEVNILCFHFISLLENYRL